MTYRDLYSKCSEYLERLSSSALEANLLKGVGNASDAVGKLIGIIPKIKDGQADEKQEISTENQNGKKSKAQITHFAFFE